MNKYTFEHLNYYTDGNIMPFMCIGYQTLSLFPDIPA